MVSSSSIHQIPTKFLIQALKREAENQRQGWWFFILCLVWITFFIIASMVAMNPSSSSSSSSLHSLTAQQMKLLVSNQISLQETKLSLVLDSLISSTSLSSSSAKHIWWLQYFSLTLLPALTSGKASCNVDFDYFVGSIDAQMTTPITINSSSSYMTCSSQENSDLIFSLLDASSYFELSFLSPTIVVDTNESFYDHDDVVIVTESASTSSSFISSCKSSLSSSTKSIIFSRDNTTNQSSSSILKFLQSSTTVGMEINRCASSSAHETDQFSPFQVRFIVLPSSSSSNTDVTDLNQQQKSLFVISVEMNMKNSAANVSTLFFSSETVSTNVNVRKVTYQQSSSVGFISAIIMLAVTFPLCIRVFKRVKELYVKNTKMINQNNATNKTSPPVSPATSSQNQNNKNNNTNNNHQKHEKEISFSTKIRKFLPSLASDFPFLVDFTIIILFWIFAIFCFEIAVVGTFDSIATNLLAIPNNNETFFIPIDGTDRLFSQLQHLTQVRESLRGITAILSLLIIFRILVDLRLLPIQHFVSRTFRFSRKIFIVGALFSTMWILFAFSISFIAAFSGSVSPNNNNNNENGSSDFSFPFSLLSSWTCTMAGIFYLTTIGSFSPFSSSISPYQGQPDIFLLRDLASPALTETFIWIISGLVRFVVYAMILGVFVDAIISSPFRQIEASGEWIVKRVWSRISSLYFGKDREYDDDENEKQQDEDDDGDGEDDDKSKKQKDENMNSITRSRNKMIPPYIRKIFWEDLFVLMWKRKFVKNKSIKNRQSRLDWMYFSELLKFEAEKIAELDQNSQFIWTFDDYLALTFADEEDGKNCKSKQGEIAFANQHPAVDGWPFPVWHRRFIFEQAIADYEHQKLEDEEYAERFGSPLDRIVQVVLRQKMLAI